MRPILVPPPAQQAELSLALYTADIARIYFADEIDRDTSGEFLVALTVGDDVLQIVDLEKPHHPAPSAADSWTAHDPIVALTLGAIGSAVVIGSQQMGMPAWLGIGLVAAGVWVLNVVSVFVLFTMWEVVKPRLAHVNPLFQKTRSYLSQAA